MQDVINRENWAGGEEVYGNSILFDQFFCKPKAALKNKIY